MQSSILQTYGIHSPSPPALRCRNATQTSIVLEWEKLSLATATFRSLSLYRNGAKAGNIPFQPGGKREVVLSTKISGLAVDTEYGFHLVLRTSAGTYSSERIRVRTHKMTDLTGITVTPGVLPPQLLASLTIAVERIGAKLADTVRIDTTHFVCTEGRGKEWERAVEMNIPVVRPEWVEGCERDGRIVGVRVYYLNADPKLRQVGQGVGRSVVQSQQPTPQSDGIDRRDMASPPQPGTGRQDSVASGIGPASTLAPSTSALASPGPPPTPAKDYQVDPMSKAAPQVQKQDEESEDVETEEEEGEDAVKSPQPGRMNEPQEEESGEVSPISDDGPPDDLGISGLKINQPRIEDDDDEGKKEAGNGVVKSPEDGGSFSEVQL